MAKAFKIKAPEFFLKRVKEAEKWLETYREIYPKLNLKYDFNTTLSSASIDKIVPEDQMFSLLMAKQIYESLFQVAKKEAYYYIPELQGKDFYYNEKTQTITEIVQTVPKKEKVEAENA